jgi:hypothetical protein
MTGLDRLERELAQKRFHCRVSKHPVGEYSINTGEVQKYYIAFIVIIPDSEKE